MNKKFNDDFNFKRDTKYWNDYYSKNLAVNTPSPFAIFVFEKYLNLNSNSNLLELWGAVTGAIVYFFILRA